MTKKKIETKETDNTANLGIGVVRQRALDWWNKMTLEEQFYKTIEHNSLITGDKTRHPYSLTGSEIEIIYKAHVA